MDPSAQLPPGLIPSTIGANMMAAMVEMLMLGAMTFQYMTYYSSGFRDPVWIIVPTTVIFILAVFHCSTIVYMAWYYAIEHFGDPSTLTQPKIWPFPLSSLITSSIAVITKVFLIYRSHRLTQQLFVSLPLLLVTFAAWVSGLTLGAKVWMLPSIEQLSTINPILIAYLVLEMSGDWLIAGVLIWTLRRSRTGFRQSNRIVKRLFRTALQTGLFTSIAASLTMILFLAIPNTEYTVIPGFPIGCLYAITLMDTLLCRKVLREMLGEVQINSREATESSVGRISGLTNQATLNQTTSIQLQVRKEHETVVRFDGAPEKDYSFAESQSSHPYTKASAL